MSWQAWADTITNAGFKCGAIYGQQGGCWAQSNGCTLSDEEFQKISHGFQDVSQLGQTGLVVNGIKYFALLCDDTTLRGKKGDNGVLIIKSNQAIVIGVFDSRMQPGEANLKLDDVVKNLKNSGY
ncbi:profilin, required for normal timing of actin polymerization in response to thermal stress [Tieghemiomyces parasiticus]|uniref:Profilin n=1 Tax=Tieghemiomyces parasiticus TaxID=78921 RepID=A0A9W8AIN5_9FUNG|nr:profilin, required for normal timing of actin polymerization in response to thermal stress [Tieghemiomyces parasiticus]